MSLRTEPGRVATLTLARPERRNALDAATLTALAEALGACAKDPECRVVLLQGEGDHFCAGADFADLSTGASGASTTGPSTAGAAGASTGASTTGAVGARYGARFEALLRAVEEHPLPLVAKVRGAALGAGCQILAAADISVAAADATIGIPSARLGLLLDLEKIERMVRALGAPRARALLLTGRPMNGTEAAACGLVTHAVDPARLDDEAQALCEEIAAAAPLSVQGSKAAIRAVLRHGALDRADPAHAPLFAEHDAGALRALASEDLAEGMRALRERRAPRFNGR